MVHLLPSLCTDPTLFRSVMAIAGHSTIQLIAFPQDLMREFDGLVNSLLINRVEYQFEDLVKVATDYPIPDSTYYT